MDTQVGITNRQPSTVIFHPPTLVQRHDFIDPIFMIYFGLKIIFHSLASSKYMLEAVDTRT